MKLRNKDMKKYLLSVAVSTFVSLLIWHLGLTSLASLLLLFISLSDGAEVMFVYYFITILFILFVIFNLITIGFSFAVYSFIQDKFANKITKERGLI